MNALQRFENKLEELISGAFARTFRSAVQPVEISAALNREVDNSAQILSRDRRLVPNDFHVELSSGDHERLSGIGPQLTDELATLLREHASHQSYVFTGPVRITLETDDELTTGRFRVRSQSLSTVSRPAQQAPATETQVRRAGAVLEVNGQQLPLSAPGIVIGRGTDADLRIDDPGVSRRHLELRVVDGPDGPVVSVHDLGSTNGALVDGRRTGQATLHDGSVIRIGNTTMTLRHRGA
jgi:hypothetical protein